MNKKNWVFWIIGIISFFYITIEIWPQDNKKGVEMFSKVFSGENGLLNPEWGIMPSISSGLIESFQIAIIGTTFAGIFALIFGFLGSENISPKPISIFCKFLMNAIRTIPEILMAIIFIVGVGPGAFAGILALGFHSIGTLSKLTAEIIESLDPKPMEAVLAVGGSRISTFRYSAWPQILPEFLSILIYRLEINIRAASVLGMVGAGGIGKTLFFALMSRNWNNVGAIIVGIIVVVTIVDFFSSRIRAKLI